MRSYTVNVAGDVVAETKKAGYHAYHAGGVTAIEIKAANKAAARKIAKQFGKVLYIFE